MNRHLNEKAWRVRVVYCNHQAEDFHVRAATPAGAISHAMARVPYRVRPIVDIVHVELE